MWLDLRHRDNHIHVVVDDMPRFAEHFAPVQTLQAIRASFSVSVAKPQKRLKLLRRGGKVIRSEILGQEKFATI